MKTKNFFYTFIVILYIPITIHGTIANYNHFPTLTPLHILDEKLTNISFAFSMRVLESDYNGPLIRLRRASDNSEKDFGWGDNDIVDVAAINAWRSGSNVYVHTWYDQSGLGRDAVQTISSKQPRFYADVAYPYFQGNGVDDYLTIDTPNGIQDVTHAGKEGTIISILKATNKSQYTFGVANGINRWSAHTNWSNGNIYFDPGICCNNPRSFLNNTNTNKWAQYTFIRTNANIIMRTNALEKVNEAYTLGACTRTEDFAIGWATGASSSEKSTTGFIEFIMYKIDIDAIKYKKIENNSIIFWGL